MENEWKKPIQKPLGVYWLSIIVFLNFGVYQFLNDFIAMRDSETEVPILITILLISLDVFSASAAVWAFLGGNFGRIALLIFISLNMLWSVFYLIIAVSYSNFDENLFFFIFSLIKPLILLGVCWWYFTDKSVLAYYKQDD